MNRKDAYKKGINDAEELHFIQGENDVTALKLENDKMFYIGRWSFLNGTDGVHHIKAIADVATGNLLVEVTTPDGKNTQDRTDVGLQA